MDAQASLSGIGGQTSLKQSEVLVVIFGPEGRSALIRPYVLPGSPTLWGRDCLSQWGMHLSTDFP